MKTISCGLFGALCLCLTSFGSPGRPTILCQDQDLPALRDKIASVDWARQSFDAIRANVEVYANRHQTDPQWILSRYQMYWKHGSRRTNAYYSGSTRGITNETGDNPWPTVRVNDYIYITANSQGEPYVFPPPLDLAPPFNETGRLTLRTATGDYETNVLGGVAVYSINSVINNLAVQSSFLWWMTRQEKYGRLAADILMLATRGIASFNHVIGSGNGGVVTIQTLDDANYALPLAVTYDFLYDYLVEAAGKKFTTVTPPSGPALTYSVGPQPHIAQAFEKFCDSFLNFGPPNNNWNAVEGMQMVYLALAMDNPAKRDLYLGYYLSNSAPQFWPVGKMISNLFSADMVWEEPASYNNYPIMHLVPATVALHRRGIPIYNWFPQLLQCATSLAPYSYPNGNYPNYGDNHGLGVLTTAPAEQMLPIAQSLGRTADVESLSQNLRRLMANAGYTRKAGSGVAGLAHLVQALPSLPPAQGDGDLGTTDIVDYAGLLLQRNGTDNRYGMQMTVYAAPSSATNYNHCHGQGLGMELYGRGFILGPDGGADYAYTTTLHSNYFWQFGKANTVVVNGNSHTVNKTRGYNLFPSGRVLNPMHVLQVEPAVGNPPISPFHSFSDVFFQDGTNGVPATGHLVTNTPHVAHQRRVNGIVRTGDTTGFYVDIFRSKWISGDAAIRGNTDTSEKYHDYLYHNLGWSGADSLTLKDPSGRSLPLTATTLPDTADRTPGWNGPGFEYFSNQMTTGPLATNLVADFDFTPAHMRAWVLGGPGRQAIRVAAPLAGPAPATLKAVQGDSGTMPCLVVRQTGEAWNRPFVVVYEPHEGHPSITSVRAFTGVPTNVDFAGVVVSSEGDTPDLKGRTDRIFCATNGSRAWSFPDEGFNFQGTYGTWAENKNGFLSAYLGYGNKVARIGSHKIQISNGGSGSAMLRRAGRSYFYTSASNVQVTLRTPNPSAGPFTNLALYTLHQGALVMAATVFTTPDPSGREGLVGGFLPPGTNRPVVVGPRGMTGLGTETRISFLVGGRLATSARVPCTRQDALAFSIESPCGLDAGRATLRAGGQPIPPEQYQIVKVDDTRLRVELTRVSDLPAGPLSLSATNNFDQGAETTVEPQFRDSRDGVSLGPNPVRFRQGGVSLSWVQDGQETGVRCRIRGLGGNTIFEKGPLPLGSGRKDLVWDGRTQGGMGVAPGIYIVEILLEGGAAQVPPGKLVVAP